MHYGERIFGEAGKGPKGKVEDVVAIKMFMIGSEKWNMIWVGNNKYDFGDTPLILLLLRVWYEGIK